MPYAKGLIDFNHFFIEYVHGDLCKHLGIDSSTDLDDRSKCLHKSPCVCRILKNDLIL